MGIYYVYGKNNILLSRITINTTLAENRTNITKTTPSQHDRTKVNKFINGIWVLVDVQITPTFNKTVLIANAVDAVVISNLPDQYSIQIDSDDSVSSDDVTSEITMDTPGTYAVTISSDQMLDYIMEITAI